MNEPVALLPHLPLVTRAIDISSRTRSGYYDFLYVALAEREGCTCLEYRRAERQGQHGAEPAELVAKKVLHQRARGSLMIQCP